MLIHLLTWLYNLYSFRELAHIRKKTVQFDFITVFSGLSAFFHF